jgi:lipopolysaccharide export system ATP-binding protein
MAIIKKFRIKSFKEENPVLSLENISLSFSNRLILDKISFKLYKGQILGLLGPNGVGKSTIFNLITGLLNPNIGKIIINNENVVSYPVSKRARKFRIGYVPQHGGYFHDLTLAENLQAIAEIQINDINQRVLKIKNLISQFEFENVLHVKSKFLSGGQKKKLVIAMSLLSKPQVLLLDEPFAALDILTIKMLKELIISLQIANNLSVCICDHQARDLLSCVDIALVLSNCKIIANGTPSELIKNNKAQIAYFGETFKLS